MKIVNQVSQNLIAIVKSLKNRPKYILSKGGITTSDIAIKALQVTRADVIGQAIKGVLVGVWVKVPNFPNYPILYFPVMWGATMPFIT